MITNSITRLRDRIHRDLNWSMWSEQELDELLTATKDISLPSLPCVSLPSHPSQTLPDPRFSHPSFTDLLWTQEHRCLDLGLLRLKGNLILRLETVLITVISEEDCMSTEEPTRTDSLASLSHGWIYIETETGRVRVGERPGASEFLADLCDCYRLYFVSKIPNKQRKEVIRRLNWERYVEDMVEDREVCRLDERFPRLADRQERGVTVIFDCEMGRWKREDQGLVIPSLRYEVLGRDVRRYEVEREVAIERMDWVRVKTGCWQLRNVGGRLKRSMMEVFRGKYRRTLRETYISAAELPKHIHIRITDEQLQVLTRTISSLLHMEESDLAHAEIVIVEDSNTVVEFDVPVWSVSALVRAYFDVKE